MKNIKAINFNVVDHSLWIVPRIGESIKIDPAESLALRNHSPTGFTWGFGGSGPAQTALAILLKVTDEGTALRFYQDFKWEVIAKLGMSKSHTLPIKTIKTWLKWKKRGVSGLF